MEKITIQYVVQAQNNVRSVKPKSTLSTGILRKDQITMLLLITSTAYLCSAFTYTIVSGECILR